MTAMSTSQLVASLDQFFSFIHKNPSKPYTTTTSPHFQPYPLPPHNKHSIRSLAGAYPIALEKQAECDVAGSIQANKQLDLVLAAALAESTTSKYCSSLQAFFQFCDAERVPLHFWLPASEHLLCCFAASKAGTHVCNSVQNNISAVRAWHIIQGVAWNGGLRLSYVLRDIENLAPDGKPPHPPVTREMLELLHSNLDASIPTNACILAAADTAFWTQSRLGELFSTSSLHFDPQKIPSQAHLSTPSAINGSHTLHYPWTKTKKSASDTSTIT
ncbi:hypothetical protein BKA93DRAFT_751273 [Sparassis latifolia]